jgi:hypothetical protein
MALTARYHAGRIGGDAYNAGLRQITAQREADMDALKKHKDHVDRHAEALARDAAAMDVNAARAGPGQGLSRSGQVGDRRRGAQKALTDATRKGIDGEAQTRRQLAIMLPTAPCRPASRSPSCAPRRRRGAS